MKAFNPKEYRVVALRECPVPEEMVLCDTPEKAVEYWRLHIQTAPQFDSERECLAVLFLTTRRRVKGHQLVSVGSKDGLIIEATMIYRTAIIAAAAAILVMHSHPSQEPEPSVADIKATRDLVRAGDLLKVELLDHVIVGAGNPGFRSLRELGYLSK